jgi:predicted MFS family arabinose efflux permease
MFHSGVFSWLGFYFSKRFGLGDQGVGLALLGYGVPGMIFGPAVGRAADQLGRRHIIPIGLWIAALSAALLIPQVTLWVACVAITVLSFGFDMSHPLLAGIVSDLNPEKRGQSMGLNAFFLFMGFGSGALIFQYFLKLGIGSALGIFAGVQIVFALVSLRAFQEEGRLAVSTRDVN